MILELAAGSWRAAVAPDVGGNIVGLRFDGRDVLAPARADNADPYLVGSPMLLPANRTAGGRFCFEGRVWQLPINEPKGGSHVTACCIRRCFPSRKAAARRRG